MMFEIIIIIIGSGLMFLGLIGSVLPVLPGPPLSFLGLLLLALIRGFSPPLTGPLILIMAFVTLAVTLIDHFLPMIGAKRYGASKWAVWGAVIGMIIGFFYPPFGVLIGAFIGAVVLEWVVQRKKDQALKAGWGVFISFLWGTALKLGICGVMAYYFVRALI
jgi:uncharacterized protein YqgC (DUF456 family)